MAMAETPEEITTQDLLLIAEALVSWAGYPGDVDGTPRKRRAWTLVDEIAAEFELPTES